MKHARWIVAAAVLVGLSVAAFFLPVGRWTLALVEEIRDAGALGVILFSLAYVAATLLFLPGSLLTLAAGFAYGPLLGSVLVSPVSVLAATLAFILGRFFLRDWVAARVASSERFSAVDEAVGENGLKIVFLLRLSPLLPFNALNYMLGLTRVKLSHYVLASAIGMLPGTILYVYLGSLVTNAARLAAGDRPSGGLGERTLFWGGLAATAVVTVVITRVARKALSRKLDAPSAGGEAISS